MNVNVSVRMDMDSLEVIPEPVLPAGYQFRMYKPGDINTWVDVYKSAEMFNTITPEVFRKEFGFDEELISKRMIFLVDTKGDMAVGTSTAWHSDPVLGRIHWVAIRPEQQGKGLAKPLLAETLLTLKSLGHAKAWLATSTARIPAICLYLKFGFHPVVRKETERDAWRSILGQIKPELRGIVEKSLEQF